MAVIKIHLVATHSFYTPLGSVYRDSLWLPVSLSSADPLSSTPHAYCDIVRLSCGENQLISSNTRIKKRDQSCKVGHSK